MSGRNLTSSPSLPPPTQPSLFWSYQLCIGSYRWVLLLFEQEKSTLRGEGGVEHKVTKSEKGIAMPDRDEGSWEERWGGVGWKHEGRKRGKKGTTVKSSSLVYLTVITDSKTLKNLLNSFYSWMCSLCLWKLGLILLCCSSLLHGTKYFKTVIQVVNEIAIRNI